MPVNRAEVALVLSKLPLFQGLSADEAEALAGAAHERHYPAGSILFLEGDAGDVAYIVISGRIDITLTSMEGNELLLHQVAPGGHLGELALLDERPRSASARAVDETTVIAFARNDLLAHLRRNPESALRMLRFTSERLRLADEKIKILGFLDVAGRLARSLLDLDVPPGKRATIRLQHDQLAAMIGSRRPTVSTLLGRWRDAGYVVTARGELVVTNRAALEDLASM